MAANPTRFTQILGILHKHHIEKGIDPIKFRLILEDLGPTYVKIGQIMSTRQDMFSERYCNELVKLRSHVSPMPFCDVEKMIESSYKKEPYTVFKSIDTTPLGSASIAQVHKATLQSGQEVVIKVQRPGIYEQMKQDVILIRKAVKLLNVSEVLSSVVDLQVVLDEFWMTAQQEMDFLHEAQSAKRFQEIFEDVEYIEVPHVYDEFTTHHVLVMEYIDGIEVNDTVTLDANKYNRTKIADRLAYNYITQIIDYGFFHADPHSGNIRLRDHKIVWIDFGMMGELTPRDRQLMKSGIRSLANHDTTKLVDTILTLGVCKKEIDYTKFTVEIEQFMDAYLEQNLCDIDITNMVQDMFTICHHHGIMLPKGISMLARSLVTIEGTLSVLDPRVNVMKIVSQHKSTLLNLDWAKKLKSGALRFVEAQDRALDLPIQMSDILKMMHRGQLKVNLNVLGSEQPIANLDRMINRLIIGILIAALLMGSSVICTTQMKPQFMGIPLIGFIGFVIAFSMSLWLFIKMLFLHHKNKPF